MSNILITGRGWPVLAAAIMAKRRGYECRVHYDETPFTGSLLGGAQGSPLSAWFSGLGISFSDDLFQKDAPSLLYMGEQWELLGLYDVLLQSHLAEKKRFSHGLNPLEDLLFQKVRRDLSQSFERAANHHSFSGKVLDWLLSPIVDAKRVFLRQKVLKNIHSRSFWEPLLVSLESALGFSDKDCLTVQRIFLDLFMGQLYRANESALFQKLLSEATDQGVRLEKAGSEPLEVRSEGSRRFIDLKTHEKFDRIVDLSSSFEPAGPKSLSLQISRSHYPDFWPGMLLIPGKTSQEALFLELREKTENHLMARVHYSGSSESVLSRLSELFPSGYDEVEEGKPSSAPASMLLLSGHSPRLRSSGPYSSREGTLFLLRDPSSLPFLGEDWVLSLYESLPNLKKNLSS